MGLKSFFNELKRRNIYKVAVVYGITGWVLVQIASIAANTFGAPPWVMKMIITLILLGFPITLVMTWGFEITPEGVRRTVSRAEGSEEGVPNSDRYFWVGVGIVVVILFGGWWAMTQSDNSAQHTASQQEINDRSIAILPLTNLSGTDEAQPLARGLHDDLLTRLANVSDLQVISRTSVERYRDSDLSLPAIADSLGVKWVVEGGVSQIEDQVRINAQLIDPQTDSHIWAETYQRELTANDLFAIQGDIAREIVDALQAQLSSSEQERIAGAPTENLEAYRLYIQGRTTLNRATPPFDEDFWEAGKYFQQALDQDSSYALAWAGLADVIGGRFISQGLDPNSTPDSLSLPKVTQIQAAKRALELDPELGEAYAALGSAYLQQGKGPAATQALMRAIDLKPSYAQAHQLLGVTYLVLGKPEKSLNHLEIAEKLNPQHWWGRHLLYDVYIINGKYKKALEEVKIQQRMAPEWVDSYWAEFRALYKMKRYKEAQKTAEERLSLSPIPYDSQMYENAWITYLTTTDMAVGDTASARQRIRELQHNKAHPLILVYAYAALGNIDATIEEFEKIEEWGYVNTLTVRYSVFPDQMQRINEHPRYKELIRQVNQYWGLNPDGSIPGED
jgi:TolB-like protein/protein involved in temperature-dependent protein secretion